MIKVFQIVSVLLLSLSLTILACSGTQIEPPTTQPSSQTQQNTTSDTGSSTTKDITSEELPALPEQTSPEDIPAPASFVVTNLSISPDNVAQGDPVTVKATVINSGGSPGNYEAVLIVNNSEVEAKSIILDVEESQIVSFTVVKASAGNYKAEIDSLSGTFSVKETKPQYEPSCMCYSYTLKKNIPCEQATAICKDGTCSTSKNRSGTCSHHGGVARWIK